MGAAQIVMIIIQLIPEIVKVIEVLLASPEFKDIVAKIKSLIPA